MSAALAMPMIGLGTWKIPAAAASDIVYRSIKEHGVRHIDCACDYGNEVEVGKGINQAISEGVVTREQLWITSKLWNTYHSPDHVEMACRRSLQDLGLSYLDLYLIHFPISLKFVPFETRYPPEWTYDPQGDNKIVEVNEPLIGTWTAMEQLVSKDLTRHIGVSNFGGQLIMELLSYCKIRPYANQIELHPYMTQQTLVDFCHSKGIKTTALSPLGSPSYVELNMDYGLGKGILEDEVITSIAKTHGKTPAQVILRWNVQRGVSVIPKSSQITRIAENFSILGFTLSENEMKCISDLNKNLRFNDPGEFCKGMGGAIPIYC